MISYYDLLGMIKEGNEPDLVRLRLNCGEVYYQAFYDGDEFNYYGLFDGDNENDDFKYYLADSLLESQMFEKNIEVIEGKRIEKLKIAKITDDNFNGLKKSINVLHKEIESKINEIIDEINKLRGYK